MNDNFNPPIIDEERNQEDMFTRAFTQQNNPARVASDAARREYSRILAESRAQERSTQESYSDMFARMRQSAFRRRQATPAQGFTGGMAQQGREALSAAEMAQMGALGRSQEQALREIRTGRQSAFSNALIAGQQQSDYARMLQDAAFQRQQTVEAILTSPEYDEDAKRRLLSNLGLNREQVNNLIEPPTSQSPRTSYVQQQEDVYRQLEVDPSEFNWFQRGLRYLIED